MEASMALSTRAQQMYWCSPKRAAISLAVRAMRVVVTHSNGSRSWSRHFRPMPAEANEKRRYSRLAPRCSCDGNESTCHPREGAHVLRGDAKLVLGAMT